MITPKLHLFGYIFRSLEIPHPFQMILSSNHISLTIYLLGTEVCFEVCFGVCTLSVICFFLFAHHVLTFQLCMFAWGNYRSWSICNSANENSYGNLCVFRFHTLRHELDLVSAQLSRSRLRMIQRARLDPEDTDSETDSDDESFHFNGRYYSPSLESSGEISLPHGNQDRLDRLYDSVSLESNAEMVVPAAHMAQQEGNDHHHAIRSQHPIFRSPQQMFLRQDIQVPQSAGMDRHINVPGYSEAHHSSEGHTSSRNNPPSSESVQGSNIARHIDSIEITSRPGLGHADPTLHQNPDRNCWLSDAWLREKFLISRASC